MKNISESLKYLVLASLMKYTKMLINYAVFFMVYSYLGINEFVNKLPSPPLKLMGTRGTFS